MFEDVVEHAKFLRLRRKLYLGLVYAWYLLGISLVFSYFFSMCGGTAKEPSKD